MRITYLLDTNIVSYLLRKAPRPLLDRLAATSRDDIAISIITAMELRFGVARNPLARNVKTAVETFLGAFPILNLPDGIAPLYGKVRADLERRGTPIGPLDNIIAAHALSLDATLVTNNTREFRRVTGLVCEDWTRRARERRH